MTAAFKTLSADVSVWSQLWPSGIARVSQAGYSRIINNRPDGEEADQPTGAEIESAARTAGLDYLHVPVSGMPDKAAIDAFQAALEQPGRTLAFCRSGMRSTMMWALVRARQGAPSGEIREQAAQAGYDLSRLPL